MSITIARLFTVGSLQVHAGSTSLYGGLYGDNRGEIRIGPFETQQLANTFAREHLHKCLKGLVEGGVLEPKPPRVSPHIPATEEYEVLDVNRIGFGALLRRSDFYRSEPANIHPDCLGIMVSMSFFQDSKGRVHAWPVVHWEGQVASKLTCPRLVKLYREDATAPRIVIDNGQWGTHGPPTDS